MPPHHAPFRWNPDYWRYSSDCLVPHGIPKGFQVSCAFDDGNVHMIRPREGRAISRCSFVPPCFSRDLGTAAGGGTDVCHLGVSARVRKGGTEVIWGGELRVLNGRCRITRLLDKHLCIRFSYVCGAVVVPIVGARYVDLFYLLNIDVRKQKGARSLCRR